MDQVDFGSPICFETLHQLWSSKVNVVAARRAARRGISKCTFVLCIHSFWSGETFKLCQTLWRGTTNKDLEGLEKLAEAVSLVPCYDLMDAPTSIVEHDTTSWKSIVYDYRWMNEQDINHLGLPPKTYVMICFSCAAISCI